MAGEYLRKKWGINFDENDLNKDGVMTMEDANIFTERFIKQHNITGGRAKQMKDEFRALWNSLFLFGREEMDRKTYLEMMEREYTENKSTFSERIGRAVQEAFDLFDANSDGVLSEEEYVIICKCWGVENLDREYVQAFPQIKPGIIGKQEFVDSWVAFCTNDDSSNTELEQPVLIGYKMVDHM